MSQENPDELYKVKYDAATIRVEKDEQIDHLYTLLDLNRTHDIHVIIESFDDRIRKVKTELVSLEYIGAIKGWCRENDVPYTTQTPSQGKAFFTNEKLQACGLLMRPLHTHKDANDAMRHLLQWQLNNDPSARAAILQKLKK
jgi:hypothetical protein